MHNLSSMIFFDHHHLLLLKVSLQISKLSLQLPFSIDDLLQAGILEAETVVVTDQLQSMEGINSDEEYMADAYTIVGVQTIYR